MRLYFIHSLWMNFLIIMSTILTLDALNEINRKHFYSLFFRIIMVKNSFYNYYLKMLYLLIIIFLNKYSHRNYMTAQ